MANTACLATPKQRLPHICFFWRPFASIYSYVKILDVYTCFDPSSKVCMLGNNVRFFLKANIVFTVKWRNLLNFQNQSNHVNDMGETKYEWK